MTEPIRVAVTGAAGQISYALLFRIAAGGMFGPTQPVALNLLEVPQAMPLLEATMMELRDCALPILAEVRGTDDPHAAFENADWIILLGGAPYKPGVTRSDLLRANGPIFRAQGRAINETAKNARILVVANPCNTNCLVAQSVARDVPSERWFAMTRLDQNRARALLADKAGVHVEKVNRVTVWGNHSPTIYPDFHNAYIHDRPAPEVIHDTDWVRQVWEPTVCNRGLQIVQVRGASPAGSAAQAIIATIRALTIPTPFEHRFSAAVCSDGSYGVPRGLVFSFPLRTEDGKHWSIVQGLYLDNYAQQRIAKNIAELEFEATAVTDILAGAR
jgi:malate dehydrogenase